MRLLSKLTETVKLKIEDIDDLWTLYTILDTNDIIKGSTLRKIVIGNKDVEKAKVIKKPVFLSIITQKIKFEEDTLKILGTILEGPEDIPKGSHHSFNIQENDEITIEKHWLNYQIKKLNDSCNKKKVKIISCLFNREEAIFAKLEKNYFTKISNINGTVAKKDIEQNSTNFFAEITKILEELNIRYEPNFIIMGSSHFWKSPMTKEIEGKSFSNKCIFTTINSVTENGFSELLLKQEVETALKNQEAVTDAKIIDLVFKKIMNNEPVCYGLKDCVKYAELGAIEKILCTENLIKKMREEETFTILEEIFKKIESNKGEIHILSGRSDAIKRLDGLGGISAILRYKA